MEAMLATFRISTAMSAAQFESCAVYLGLTRGASLLVPCGEAEIANEIRMHRNSNSDAEFRAVSVTDVQLVLLGRLEPKLYMIAILSDHTLMAYQGFCSTNRHTEWQMCFSRCELPLSVMDPLPEEGMPSFGASGYSRILQCANVGGHQGVLVCGDTPAWLSAQHGILRAHPFSYEGAVHACTPFHNMACSHGLLHYNEDKQVLKVSQIGEEVSLDQMLPIRRVPLRCTVHQVIYEPSMSLYILVTSEMHQDYKAP